MHPKSPISIWSDFRNDIRSKMASTINLKSDLGSTALSAANRTPRTGAVALPSSQQNAPY